MSLFVYIVHCNFLFSYCSTEKKILFVCEWFLSVAPDTMCVCLHGVNSVNVCCFCLLVF